MYVRLTNKTGLVRQGHSCEIIEKYRYLLDPVVEKEGVEQGCFNGDGAFSAQMGSDSITH